MYREHVTKSGHKIRFCVCGRLIKPRAKSCGRANCPGTKEQNRK